VKILITVFLILFNLPANAEQKFWFDLQVGYSDSSSASFGYQLSYGKKSRVYSLGAYVHDICVFCDEGLGEVYFTAGEIVEKGFGIATLQIGLSLVGSEFENRTGVGIPISIRYTLGKYAGVGIGFHANINRFESVGIVTINFALGKFR
jgi:hypothetical protein